MGNPRKLQVSGLVSLPKSNIVKDLVSKDKEENTREQHPMLTSAYTCM